MDIKTYDLIINTRTKHTSLQVKESFAYGAEYFTTPLAIFKLMTEVFHLHQMSDEYVYMLPMRECPKVCVNLQTDVR